VFGDRISRRRQSAELGHQLPAQARPFIAWLGSRPSDVNWLVDLQSEAPLHASATLPIGLEPLLLASG
jgi:hypothetical protein